MGSDLPGLYLCTGKRCPDYQRRSFPSARHGFIRFPQYADGEDFFVYRNSFRLALLPLPVLIVLRCVLKILFISPETGFLDGAPLLPWSFRLLLCGFAVVAVFTVLRTADIGISCLRGNRVLEISGVLCAVMIFCVGVLGLLALRNPDTSVNVLPRWLRVLCHVLALASGAVLVWLSVASLSGANHTETAGIAALVPAVWQALYLVNRFISFREVTTVSDHLLETLFWICALLFWMAHARCIAGTVPNRRRAVLFALLCALFGVPAAIGQLAALSVFGTCTGPEVSVCVLMLLTSIYAVCFALSAAASPAAQEIPPEE